MRRLRSASVVGALIATAWIAGCGPDQPMAEDIDIQPPDFKPGDMAVSVDKTALDLAEPVPDIAEQLPDLPDPPDAEVDLAMPDLTQVPDAPPPDLAGVDRAMSPDVALTIDMAGPRDMAMVTDVGTPPDMAAPRDIAMVIDLADPRDLRPVYDLSGDIFVPPINNDMFSQLPPSVISHNDWAAFCKAFTSCSNGFFGSGLSRCMGLQPKPGVQPFATDATLKCVAAAGADCVKIYECLNGANANVNCVPGGIAECNNNVRSICLNLGNNMGKKLALQCMAFGLQCVTNVSNPVCGIGSCNVPDGGGAVQGCFGDWTSECRQGTQTANENCKVWDIAKCAVNNNIASCVGSGAACAKGRCVVVNGKSLWLECKSGREAAFDCGQQALTCVEAVGDGGVLGVTGCRNGNACDTGTYQETCNGDVLSYCDYGVVKTSNCKTDGWVKCVPRGKTDAGVATGGYCSP